MTTLSMRIFEPPVPPFRQRVQYGESLITNQMCKVFQGVNAAITNFHIFMTIIISLAQCTVQSVHN